MEEDVLLYIYVMGSNNGADHVAPAAVPCKISSDELFFGPVNLTSEKISRLDSWDKRKEYFQKIWVKEF